MNAVLCYKESQDMSSTAISKIAVLKEMEHPNTIQPLDVVRAEDKLFVVFQYVNIDLKKHLEDFGIDREYLLPKPSPALSLEPHLDLFV